MNTRNDSDAPEVAKAKPPYFARYGIRVAMLHERGRGNGFARRQRMHAVPTTGVALCGFCPKYEWSSPEDVNVTCPKCLAKMARDLK